VVLLVVLVEVLLLVVLLLQLLLTQLRLLLLLRAALVLPIERVGVVGAHVLVLHLSMGKRNTKEPPEGQ